MTTPTPPLPPGLPALEDRPKCPNCGNPVHWHSQGAHEAGHCMKHIPIISGAATMEHGLLKALATTAMAAQPCKLVPAPPAGEVKPGKVSPASNLAIFLRTVEPCGLSYQRDAADIIERLSRETAAKDAEIAGWKRVYGHELPRIGGWDNKCPLCFESTQCGDILHKTTCPFLLVDPTLPTTATPSQPGE